MDGASYDADKSTALIGYWRFEEGSGTTITDHSGNGNDGTLTGTGFDTTDYPGV